MDLESNFLKDMHTNCHFTISNRHFVSRKIIIYFKKIFFALFEWTNEYAIKLVIARADDELHGKWQNRKSGK